MPTITAVRTYVATFAPFCSYVLVRIETSDGVHGWGDASLAGKESGVRGVIDDSFTPLLLGRDALDSEDLWQLLFRGGYWRGGPVLMSALAGVDMALWDIKGKVAGLPVYQLLGGRCRTGALAYTHAHGATTEELLDSVRAIVERGYKVVRCQGAGYGWTARAAGERPPSWPPAPPGPTELFDASEYLRATPAMFDAVREELGFDVELCHDTHERLTPIEAARLARDLEPHRLFFLEDLLRPEWPDGFRTVREASVTPLAMGELYFSMEDCLPVVTNRLIDYIRCDLAHSGGITSGRRIATVADVYSVKTAWHGPPDISPITHAANVHLDLATPNFGVQEHTVHPEPVADVITGGPTFADGYLHVTSAPGLGVDVDEAALASFPYSTPPRVPIARRADGSLSDW